MRSTRSACHAFHLKTEYARLRLFDVSIDGRSLVPMGDLLKYLRNMPARLVTCGFIVAVRAMIYSNKVTRFRLPLKSPSPARIASISLGQTRPKVRSLAYRPERNCFIICAPMVSRSNALQVAFGIQSCHWAGAFCIIYNSLFLSLSPDDQKYPAYA